jgi:hypothetical protein
MKETKQPFYLKNYKHLKQKNLQKKKLFAEHPKKKKSKINKKKPQK